MRLYADILERHGMTDFVYHSPVEEHIDYRTTATVVEAVRPSVPPIAAMRECVCGALITDEPTGRMDWPDGTPHTHRQPKDELWQAPAGHASELETPQLRTPSKPAPSSTWRIEVKTR